MLALTLALFPLQLADAELIDLDLGPVEPASAEDAEVFGNALGRLWIGGRREGIGTEIWTLGAPGSPLQPFFLGGLASSARQLRGVYDLGNGRALIVAIGKASNQVSLFATDGTSSGVELLPVTIELNQLDNIVVDGGRAYFPGTTPATGQELFATDGTVAGTTLVHESLAGPLGNAVLDLELVNGRLVWATITKVRSVATSGGPSELLIAGTPPNDFTMGLAGGRLVFPLTQQSSLGEELYSTDGTVAGTSLLREIDTGTPTPGSEGSSPRVLASDGSVTYFTARTDAEGRELWRTDGTTAGTTLVADLTPGPGDTGFESTFLGLLDAAFLGAGLVFRADTPATGLEPWFTDGTPAGTVLLADVASGPASSGFGSPTRVGNLVLFSAFEPVTGFEPWVTDGTPAGTRRLVDVAPGPDSGGTPSIVEFAGHGYWIGPTAASGVEPLGVDPQTGTVSVAELALDLGNASAGFAYAISEGGRGYLTTQEVGDSGSVETRVYRTDGTAAGTERILPDESTGGFFGLLDGRGLLFVDTPGLGFEPWITDESGTSATLLGDLTPGPGSTSGSITGGLRLGDFLYFSARTPLTGTELFRTDGTPGGTGLAVELVPGAGSGLLRAIVQDEFLFLASEFGTSLPASLYRSDGTQAGTQPFAPAQIGTDLVTALYQVNGRLFFQTVDPFDTEARLWSTSGSEADLRLEVDVQESLLLIPVEGQVLALNQDQLFRVRVDGTLELLASALQPEGLLGLNFTETHVYFTPNSFGPESAVWATDGTVAGTVEITPAGGLFGGTLSLFGPVVGPVAEGPEVLFSNGTPDTGFEPWITDGTLAGTFPLADLAPGQPGSEPQAAGRVGDRFLVSGFETATGREVYSFALEDTDAYAARPFGGGCGIASLPDLRLEGEARLGAQVTVEVENASPSAPVLLYAAGGAAFQDLGACTLYLNGLLSIGVGISAPAGSAGFDFQLSSDPKWLGVPLYLQAAAIQPGGPFLNLVELTNGLEIVFGPQ